MEGSSLVWARYLVQGIALARKATTKSPRGRGHQAAAPDRSEDNGRARGLFGSRRPRDPSESFAFARVLGTALRAERARAEPARPEPKLRFQLRRYAGNVRGPSPRTPLVLTLGGGSLPCGHGR